MKNQHWICLTTPICSVLYRPQIYASRTYPVDVSDARNLISARRLGNMLLLKPEECEHADSRDGSRSVARR